MSHPVEQYLIVRRGFANAVKCECSYNINSPFCLFVNPYWITPLVKFCGCCYEWYLSTFEDWDVSNWYVVTITRTLLWHHTKKRSNKEKNSCVWQSTGLQSGAFKHSNVTFKCLKTFNKEIKRTMGHRHKKQFNNRRKLLKRRSKWCIGGYTACTFVRFL